MDEKPIIGAIFFVLGILMAAFHRRLGVGFCKIGKSISRTTSVMLDDSITKDMVEGMGEIYDEAKAPRIMRLLGISFVVQGVVFWFLP